MKKVKLLMVALATVMTLSANLNLSASVVNVGDTISFSSPSYRIGNGGEFRVNRISPNAQNNIFRTFCVELTETINFGTHYTVGGITTATVMSNKALSTGAAALYLGFRQATGTILGQSYDLGGGAQQGADGRSLQLALWHTMGWSSSWGSSLQTEYNGDTKAQNWVAAANVFSFAFSSDAFGYVRVMNVREYNVNGDQTDANGQRYYNRQDQLTIIPEPGSLLVWGALSLSVSGLALGRRRRA